MKNTYLRFLAAAAIAGGMLLAAQEVGSQPAQPQAVRQSAQPLRQQLKQVRVAMFQAVRANDTAGIEQTTGQG